MLYLLIFFMILMFGGVFFMAAWYLLPWLILFWAVMGIIEYFREKSRRKKRQKQMEEQFGEFANTQTAQKKMVEKRAPKQDSIDVEYTEVYEEPMLEAPDKKDSQNNS